MSTPTEPINVVIVDDHRMFAECLGRMLDEQDGIQVVGTAVSGRDALDLVTAVQPHVLLIDYQMPEQNGATTASEIMRVLPDIAAVMLSEDSDPTTAMEAINAGCSGFLTKSASAAEVAGAVRASAAGEAHISPALLLRLLKSRSDNPASGSELTSRESQTLALLARGWTNKVIAAEMGVTTSTIRNTVQSILAKLDAHSKLEAVATAVRRGLISYPSTG